MKKKLYSIFSIVLIAFLVTGCYVNEFDETHQEGADRNDQGVNIAELKKDVEHFSSDITPIAINCNSIKEMEDHLNDIKKLEGVKTAWVEENAFCIEDKQGFIHIWDFQIDTVEDNLTENNYTRLMTATEDSNTRAKTFNKSACLIMTDDYGVYRKDDRDYLTSLLNKHNYKVTFVSGEDFTPDYFVSDQYKSDRGKMAKLDSFANHDLYIIRAHGFYNTHSKSHWLTTDLTLSDLDGNYFETYPWLKAETSNGKKASGFLYKLEKPYTWNEETQKYEENEELPFNMVNVMISEDFFIEYCDKFSKGDPIILCSSCQSMANNINLGSTFVDILGAGMFLGMTADNAHGRYAIMRILQLMLDYNYSFLGATNALKNFEIKYFQYRKNDNIGRWYTFAGCDLMDWYPREYDCVLNPHNPIDMGTSVKWARWNIGANSIYELGDSLRWAETRPWSRYLYNTSQLFPEFSKIPDGDAHYGKGLPDKKYAKDYEYEERNIGGDPQKDAATANWGKDWRLPTKKEFEELLDESKFNIERITDTTPNYLKITNKADPNKIIVFPYPDISWFSFSSYVCPYWTSDFYHCVNDKGENEMEAWSLLFTLTFPIMSDCPGYYAGYVRPVYEDQ